MKNGIDIIRIFDALNDVRNLEVAIDETVKQGAHASGTISFTTSPVHTLEKNVQMVKDLKSMGVKSICIKDMAGLMGPKEAYDLVSAIKDAVPELPLVIHTHCTTGLAYMTQLKAVEAGADVLDTAISPFSGGTSQPATESVAYALRHMGYEVDLNDQALTKMADFFKGVRADFLKSGTLDPISMSTDTQCLNYQIPGGMLSNLISQLKMMNAIDKLDQVLEEFDRVIGLERLKAIHMNDSKNPFASHKDRHEKIGEGSIGLEAFERMVNHPKLQGIPIYLETPNELEGYAREIRVLREMER